MADLAPLATRIRREIGHDAVIDDRDVIASYETDWTGRYQGRAGLVVRPADIAELAASLGLITTAGVAVVPQGGNTGLVGGSIPRDGEVVISTQRMTDVETGATGADVVVSAGATLGRLQGHAHAMGMEFAVDLASRDSATVGGMIATNAGGIHVVRWGRMRSQVLGVEAVLPDGEVVEHLYTADEAATELVERFAGSEGTLGIISRARLRLIPDQPHKVVVLLAFDTTDAAIQAAINLAAVLPGIDAVEYFGSDALELVRDHRGLRPPFPTGQDAYLLVEVSGEEDPSPVLETALEGTLGMTNSAVGIEPGPRRALWELRESITEAISAAGVPQKHDVWLPPAAVPEFGRSLSGLADQTGVSIVMFGHVAEGSLHVNALGLEPDDRSIEDRIYRLVLDHGGSPISEHGVGATKLRWQTQVLGPDELAGLRATKRHYDPANLLNPGVLVPPV